MNYWQQEAHNEIAKAVQDVWNLQHALTESGGSVTQQVVGLSKLLSRRAQIIEGHMERWKLWEADEARKHEAC